MTLKEKLEKNFFIKYNYVFLYIIVIIGLLYSVNREPYALTPWLCKTYFITALIFNLLITLPFQILLSNHIANNGYKYFFMVCFIFVEIFRNGTVNIYVRYIIFFIVGVYGLFSILSYLKEFKGRARYIKYINIIGNLMLSASLISFLIFLR